MDVTEDALVEQIKALQAEVSTLRRDMNALGKKYENIYNILAVDVWALAQTMDEAESGFWAKFMGNRERACKRLLETIRQVRPTNSKRPPFLR